MKGIRIIIPCQAFGRGKSRLAPVLDSAARKRFCRDGLRHVLRQARQVAGARNIMVVSRDAEVLGLARRMGVAGFREAGRGLNEGLEQAMYLAAREGARAVLVLHADLPLLAGREVRALLQALRGQCAAVLAPDAAGEGSNALGLCPPGGMRLCFGPGSYAKHCAQARGAKMRLRILSMPGLARDIDTPEHFRQWRTAAGSRVGSR